MKKFYENKIFIIVSLFVIFGAVAVVASTIGDSGYSGIQVDNYFSGSGKQGITQDISFEDYDGNNHSFSFEDGLLVNYSFVEPPVPIFPSEGLIAYYKLDGISGNVTDSVGNYNGTNNGATRGAGGKIGSSFLFDGDNDYITNIADVRGYANGTISFWLRPENLGDWQEIYSTHSTGHDNKIGISGSYVGCTNGDCAYVSHQGDWDVYSSNASLNNGSWNFISFSWNSTGEYLYLDGVLVDLDNSGIGWEATGAAAVIGVRAGLIDNDLNGYLDELGIWNRALNSTEIQALYNDGNGLTYS